MATTTATRSHRPPTRRRAASPLAEVERETTALAAALRRHVDRTPWTAVGLGLAAGYVLGGGLTPRLGAALLGAAGRSAIAGALAAAIRPTMEKGK
jgi:hypothetical protein